MDNPFSDHKTVLRAVAPDFEKDNKIPFGLHTAVVAYCLCPPDSEFTAPSGESHSPMFVVRLIVMKLSGHDPDQLVYSPFVDDFHVAVQWAMCTLILAVCKLPPLTDPTDTRHKIDSLIYEHAVRRLVPKLYPPYWNTSWDPKLCLDYFWQLLENSEPAEDLSSSLKDKASSPGTSASTALLALTRSPTVSNAAYRFTASQGSELHKCQPSNRTERSSSTISSAPMEAVDRQPESSKNAKKRKHVDPNCDEGDASRSKFRRVDSTDLLRHTYEKKLLDAEESLLEAKQQLLTAEVKNFQQRVMHLEKEKELKDRIKAFKSELAGEEE